MQNNTKINSQDPYSSQNNLPSFLARIILRVLKTIFSFKSINKWFRSCARGDERPIFFDVKKVCPQLLVLDQNYKVILEELKNVIQEETKLPTYHDLDYSQVDISASGDPNKKWKVFALYLFGIKPEHNRSLCPKTSALLDTIPNLYQAFFSILDPGKSIPAHRGPFYGYLRYHLGLMVPKTNPPSIRVKDQIYTWKEGEGVLFDDTWEHQVYNKSSEMRVVLLVDILRPMPLFFHLLNKLCKFYLRNTYGKKVMDNIMDMMK